MTACPSRVKYLLYGYTHIVRDDPCLLLQVPGRKEMSISRPRLTIGKIFILAELSLGMSLLKIRMTTSIRAKLIKSDG